MKKASIIILFILSALSSKVFAAMPVNPSYVSPTGSGSTCTIESPCALSYANANADDDDIVYLRAGTYTITTYGINPTNSGTTGHVITFSGYQDEEIILSGATDSTGFSSNGIYLSSDSYVKITKIKFQNVYRGFTIYGGGHNEISYCTFTFRNPWADVQISGTNDTLDATGVTLTDNNPVVGANLSGGAFRRVYNKTDGSTSATSSSATATTIVSGSYPLIGGSDNQWQIGDGYEVTYSYPYDASACDIHGNSTNNYIHHNIMHGIGGFTSQDGQDGSPIMQIGNDTGSTEPNNHNNTVEYNHMYNGGHHVLGVNMGLYQVVRYNYVHNESWFDDSSYSGNCAAQENCGYRVMSTSSDYGGYSLFEGNYIGYGAQYGGGNLGQGGSGSGLSIGSSNNIIRQNSFLGNVLYGMRLSSSLHPVVTDNMIYNNTFYKNGYSLDASGATENPITDDITDNARTGFKYDDTDETKIYDNVLKNNLFYSNWSERNNYGTSTYYSPLNTNTAAVDAVNTEINNYLSSDWVTYPISKSEAQGVYAAETNPLFTEATLPIGSAAIIAAWSSYVVTSPNLSLQAASTAIDGGTYLTTVHADDTSFGTSLVITDASYFQDGTWGSDLATLNADWICVGATIGAAECFQISAVNYATNTITVADFTREDGDYVWLYKKSDGTQVLYGTAPDYGAHEYVLGNSNSTMTGVYNAKGMAGAYNAKGMVGAVSN